MYTIRRSCQQALQARIALPISTTTRRAFSQTPITHRGSLPVFLPPSNPELAEVLSTINRRVLLPKHLTPEQEDLVYAKKNRTRLEAEPIEITLGDVTLPLEHIDRNRDLASRYGSLNTALKLSRTKEDWENLMRVVEGYENAGIRIRVEWRSKVIRVLGLTGNQHLILKAVQRPKATGIFLKRWPLVAATLDAMRKKAVQADWEKEELEQALKFMEQVVELMDNKAHLGKSKPEKDYRTYPAVIAAPLELAAELVHRHGGDKEKVKKYAGRLMNGLQQRGIETSQLYTLARTTESDYANSARQTTGYYQLSEKVKTLIPIWNGLSTARTVLDEEMPMEAEAQRTQQALWDAIQKGLEGLERLSQRDGAPINCTLPSLAEVKKDIEECVGEDDEA